MFFDPAMGGDLGVLLGLAAERDAHELTEHGGTLTPSIAPGRQHRVTWVGRPR